MPLPDPFDNVGMRRWVFRTLAAEDDDLATAQNVQKARELLRSKKFALEQADKGDVEPLRRKYPDLAKFIHPPKRKRGQRDFQPNDGLQVGIQIVRRIRKLWRENYGTDRRKVGQVTAIELAAEYCGVDHGQLLRRDKKGS